MNRKQRRAAAKQARHVPRSAGASLPNSSLPDQAATVHGKLAHALQLHKSGDLSAAEAAYREVISLRPDLAAAHNALGAALQAQGRSEEALAAYDASLEVDPNCTDAHSNKANLLSLMGRSIVAEPLIQSLNQPEADTHNLFNRANNHKAKGDLSEAAKLYNQIIKRDPSYAPAFANLGDTYTEMGQYEAGQAMLEASLIFDPNNAVTHNALGEALFYQGKLGDAKAAYQKSLAINPQNHSTLTNLGNTYKDCGEMDEALNAYKQGLAIAPSAGIHSNILMAMHYMAEITPQQIYVEHRRWNEAYALPLMPKHKSFKQDKDPKRRIRIGVVSGSFMRHPVGYMSLSAFEALDRTEFELFLYSNDPRKDDFTQRFTAAADNWQVITHLSDQALAQTIEQDEVDILIDLAGHSGGFRLLTLARRPAPIQIKWVGGQFNTTGMDAIDYFISDRVETPEYNDNLYTEEIVRLPHGYVVYEPPSYAPNVSPLPAAKTGVMTFGCFNNATKVNGVTIGLWAAVLHAVPNSRLVLKSKPFNDDDVCQRVKSAFVEHGIDADRLDIRGSSPHETLLAEYGDIDIALDPFPYSGGLTTVEALWMGVPVITLPGETFAGRHAASHLTNVGLQDWICESGGDYVDLAAEWSARLEELATLRSELREKVAASPLCDAAGFAKDLGRELRHMWIKWCDEQVQVKAPARIQSAGDTLLNSDAIFVGGHSRSGTTLIQGQICKHPDTIDVTKECSYLRALVEAYNLGDAWYEAHTDDYFDSREEFRTFNGQIIEQYLTLLRERFGAGRIVQKEPRLSTHFAKLAEFMPNTRFVFMLRDFRDIAASQAVRCAKSNTRFDLSSEIGRYRETISSLWKTAPLFHDRLLFVRYESLALQPIETLQSVFDFLNLPWMSQFTDTIWATKRPRFDDSASGLDGKPIEASSIGLFGSALTKTVIEEIDRQRPEFAAQLGADCFADSANSVLSMPATLVMDPNAKRLVPAAGRGRSQPSMDIAKS